MNESSREPGKPVAEDVRAAGAEAEDRSAQEEQGGYSFPAEVREEKHESCESEKGEEVGLEVLALGEVVEDAIALRPRDDEEKTAEEAQEHTAEGNKRPSQPNWGASGHLRSRFLRWAGNTLYVGCRIGLV